METLDGSGPMDKREGLYGDMNIVMRMLFYELVSPKSSNLLPNSSSNTSPHPSLVIYQNPIQFLSKLVKVIKFHIVYSTYKDDISSGRNSSCHLGL